MKSLISLFLVFTLLGCAYTPPTQKRFLRQDPITIEWLPKQVCVNGTIVWTCKVIQSTRD